PVADLVQERIVAPGGLGPALDDVPGQHGTGQGVEVVPVPAVPPGGRPGDQRGVGDPGADHDVGPGGQGVGDAPAAEVGVGRDRLAGGLGQRQAGVQVGQVKAGRGQFVQAGQQVVTGDVGDLGVQAEPLGQRGQLAGQ